MKELTFFYLERCPYCIRAKGYMEELCRENPEYAKIPVNSIEEREQRDVARGYDYYLVPCYYMGDEKLWEGAAGKDDIRKVFDRALK